MGAKKIKAKKTSISKMPDLPNLPLELVQLLFKKRYLLHHTYSPGTTKSWLTTTRRCNGTIAEPPQLYHVNDPSIDHSRVQSNFPHINNHFLTNSDAALVQCTNAAAALVSYWCLLKVNDVACGTPPVDFVPNYDKINYTNSVLIPVDVKLGGVASSTLMVLLMRYGQFRYDSVCVRHECTTIDPFHIKKKCLKFTSVVRLVRKFYALSLQGTLVVMQNVDSRLRITGMSATRAVPSVRSAYFKEYLVEMDGEIMLVFLIHKKWLGIVDKVEVYSLDLDKLVWIKVEKLQEKTLFLHEHCVWVKSTQVGCRESCIYFTQGSENRWFVYDMKTLCISPA